MLTVIGEMVANEPAVGLVTAGALAGIGAGSLFLAVEAAVKAAAGAARRRLERAAARRFEAEFGVLVAEYLPSIRAERGER